MPAGAAAAGLPAICCLMEWQVSSIATALGRLLACNSRLARLTLCFGHSCSSAFRQLVAKPFHLSCQSCIAGSGQNGISLMHALDAQVPAQPAAELHHLSNRAYCLRHSQACIPARWIPGRHCSALQCRLDSGICSNSAGVALGRDWHPPHGRLSLPQHTACGELVPLLPAVAADARSEENDPCCCPFPVWMEMAEEKPALHACVLYKCMHSHAFDRCSQ